MKQLLFPLLLFPAFALAQYPGNAGQKITLGEQTTADGLVYRGIAADTTRKPSVDTMAYILLDTNTNIIWQYKKATSNAWLKVNITPADTTSFNYVNTYNTQTVNGAKTFTSALTATRFNPTGTSATGNGMYLPATNTLGFSTNGTEQVRISSGGNVGIGVTPRNTYSDSRAIEIGANGVFWTEKDPSIYNSFSVGYNFYYNSAGSPRYKNSSITASRYTQYLGNHEFYTAPSGTIDAEISFTKIMVLDASGKLGIGTASPTARLQVTGSGVTSSSTALKVDNSGNTNLLTVLDNGTVGIGTTSPQLKFVVSNNGATGFEVNPTGNGGGIDILSYNRSSSAYTQFTMDGSLLVFNTGATERMRITSGGNVGIGNTPSDTYTGYKLQIGSISDIQTFISIGNSTTGVGPLNGLVIGNDDTGADIYQRTNAPLRIHTNNSERMRITSGGEVWIGYTGDNGAYRLQVKDSVYVGGNVSASAYTTRSDYDLKDEIQNISYGINEVMQMQPVKYTYKSNGSTQLGFIAQDLGVITPEVVSFEDKMSVYYNALIPILTKAIQEQQALIKALEQRIINLENK